VLQNQMDKRHADSKPKHGVCAQHATAAGNRQQRGASFLRWTAQLPSTPGSAFPLMDNWTWAFMPNLRWTSVPHRLALTFTGFSFKHHSIWHLRVKTERANMPGQDTVIISIHRGLDIQCSVANASASRVRARLRQRRRGARCGMVLRLLSHLSSFSGMPVPLLSATDGAAARSSNLAWAPALLRILAIPPYICGTAAPLNGDALQHRDGIVNCSVGLVPTSRHPC